MRSPLRLVWLIALVGSLPVVANAQPLHQRIDRFIADGFKEYDKHASPIATDAEFLRRVYLDLHGTIPSVTLTRQFLADPDPQKRVKLVDQLLKGTGFTRRMTQHFDTMLMDRRADSKVPRAAWEEYLRGVFDQNKPYDEFVREVLSADGVDAKTRVRAKFFLDRDFEPNLVVRDMSRLFLGRNLQCAQCHDSPLVDDFKQEHYYGLMAFLNRSFMFPNAQAATAVLAEKAEGEVSFTSVFDKSKAQKSTGPKMPGGKALEEPKFEKGKEYKVAPAANVRPVPAFSRREQLAAQITAKENPFFARTAANRLWAMMMGRGLVHPLDMDHSDNPPSHPELLDVLAAELVANKFDVKHLLREIALSKTYQRSSETPKGLTDIPPDRYLSAILKPLSPEQFAYAMIQGSGLRDSEAQLAKAETEAQIDVKQASRVQAFRQMFGNRPGDSDDSFSATLDQTLFLKNNALVRSFIVPRAGNLLERSLKLKDDPAVVEELFLTIYTRPPTDDERTDIVAELKKAGDRSAVLSEIIWAMLASAEFRFNH